MNSWAARTFPVARGNNAVSLGGLVTGLIAIIGGVVIWSINNVAPRLVYAL
jgi:hypothetical protein